MNEAKLGSLASLDDDVPPPPTTLGSGDTEYMKWKRPFLGGGRWLIYNSDLVLVHNISGNKCVGLSTLTSSSANPQLPHVRTVHLPCSFNSDTN